MKNQALFSLKDKSKKLKCRLLQFLFGALTVKSSILKNHNHADDLFITTNLRHFLVLLLRTWSRHLYHLQA